VVRPSAVTNRFEALRGSALTRLFGRDQEIDLLLRCWARAKAGDGQVALLSGEPGFGKSRIAAAVAERLHTEPHVRLRYFCSPYHQDSALYPFIDQLGRASGLARDEPPAVKLEKFEALLARTATPDEDVALLADLLSLPGSERRPLPDVSPQRKKERTLEALIRQLEGLTRRQPVLMIFEDAHWIDPTSRELLDLTVERLRSLPVLLMVTFRPEFQPPWTGQPQVTMLVLNRLDRRDGTALVEQVADGKALPDEVVAQIVDRADGVPLFVEELTKSVLESGLLREEGDRYVLNRALSPFAVPTTLHDSLMARLDRLSSVRWVAQIGAAMGREFSYALLRAVSGLPAHELQASLARLVASELVFQRGTPPDAMYSFKHALVQDAAHDSLLRTTRQQLHAQIAAALETDSPELMESQPELFAQHYAEDGLVERSVACWGKAGHRSVARSAMAEAAAHFQRALSRLAILPDNSERQRRELEFCAALAGLVLGHASSGRDLFFVGRFTSALSHLEEVLTLYDPIAHRSHVHRVGASGAFSGTVLFCLGYPDQTLERSSEAVAEARRLAHPPSLAGNLATGIRLRLLVGDIADLAAWLDQLVTVTTEQGFPHWRPMATICRGWVKVKNGDAAEGLSLLRSGSMASRTTGAWGPHNVALLARGCEITGQVEEALTLGGRCLAHRRQDGGALVRRRAEQAQGPVAAPARAIRGRRGIVSQGSEHRRGAGGQALGIARDHESRQAATRSGPPRRSPWSSRSGLRLVYRRL
jgi:hypothetical protein